MNLTKIKQWIAENNRDAVENAWMEGVEEHAPPAEMRDALEAMIAGKLAETAQTLCSLALSDAVEQGPPATALELARTVLPIMPPNPDFRVIAADLYGKVCGQTEHFKSFLRASGLEDTQSLKRAIRTLDTCLAAQVGDYLANRFDHQVVRLVGFNDSLGEFELAEPGERTRRLDPKLLADEFERVDETDFRVLCQFRTSELTAMLNGDTEAVLIGICSSRGGEIGVAALKNLLVPNYLDAGKWSGWWNKARTAAKRSESLSLEGRPAVIAHHPHGRTLEDELAETVAKAKLPLEFLGILRQYAREAASRKVRVDPAFVEPIMNTLAEQADTFRTNRPDEALEASLALEAARALGLPAPSREHPTAADELAQADEPPRLIAQLSDESLWPAALDALAARPDGLEQMEKLLRQSPTSQLDDVAGRLHAGGRSDVLARAVQDAMSRPVELWPIIVWLWAGPTVELPGMPKMIELLSRLLDLLEHLERDRQISRKARRTAYTQIRSAMTAGKYKSFRAALDEMDEGVADTIKRRVNRSDGLTFSCRENLLGIIRERFYGLFLTAKVPPWEDESVLWTSEKALHAQEAKLKDLVDVQLPANSRAIGEAASHGDLSENSEWQYAIEEQRRLNDRVIHMQNELLKARIIQPEDVPTDKVGVGARVTLRRASDGRTTEMRFLGPWDSNVEQYIFFYKTPLALSLMGQAIGGSATLKIDGGEEQYVIERIDSAIAPAGHRPGVPTPGEAGAQGERA